MNRPKAGFEKLRNNLGLDVTLETKKLEPDAWAQTMQKEIGKILGKQIPTAVHKCSISTHCYTRKDEVSGNNELFFIHVLPDLSVFISQDVAATWNNDIGIRMRAKYGKDYRVASAQFDKRGQFQE